MPWQSLASGGSGGAIDDFGDGSDGVAVFDGVTTFNNFSTLAANVYTLTRDTVLASGSLNAGITINTNGWRLFVQGAFTNNAVAPAGIINNGGNGGAPTAGVATATNSLGEGTAGGAGGNNAAGAAGVNNQNEASGAVTGGGAGGAGTNGGGAGGTVAATTASTVRAAPFCAMGAAIHRLSGLTSFRGGAGGGGGGSSAVTTNGGGGGGGGGVLMFACFALTNNGNISANGGNGGNASAGAGNGGGGGGGSGGLCIVVTHSLSGAGPITANGGTGGTPNNAGVAGAAGGAGVVVKVQN